MVEIGHVVMRMQVDSSSGKGRWTGILGAARRSWWRCCIWTWTGRSGGKEHRREGSTSTCTSVRISGHVLWTSSLPMSSARGQYLYTQRLTQKPLFWPAGVGPALAQETLSLSPSLSHIQSIVHLQHDGTNTDIATYCMYIATYLGYLGYLGKLGLQTYKSRSNTLPVTLIKTCYNKVPLTIDPLGHLGQCNWRQGHRASGRRRRMAYYLSRYLVKVGSSFVCTRCVDIPRYLTCRSTGSVNSQLTLPVSLSLSLMFEQT